MRTYCMLSVLLKTGTMEFTLIDSYLGYQEERNGMNTSKPWTNFTANGLICGSVALTAPYNKWLDTPCSDY